MNCECWEAFVLELELFVCVWHCLFQSWWSWHKSPLWLQTEQDCHSHSRLMQIPHTLPIVNFATLWLQIMAVNWSPSLMNLFFFLKKKKRLMFVYMKELKRVGERCSIHMYTAQICAITRPKQRLWNSIHVLHVSARNQTFQAFSVSQKHQQGAALAVEQLGLTGA